MGKPARLSVARSIRFEVFKRDRFSCQYCGRRAPEVVLHLDHIQPVSKGGSNEVLNLVTSCAECNLGKGAKVLSDDAVVSRQVASLQELEDRRQQLEMLLEWQQSLSNFNDEIVERLALHWEGLAPEWNLAESGKDELAAFIHKYGEVAVLEAMGIAAAQYIHRDRRLDEIPAEKWDLAWRRLGGILSIKAQGGLDDSMRKLYYIRGIVRNKCPHYFDEPKATRWLKLAVEHGANLDDLESCVKQVSNWTTFRMLMEDVIGSEL